MTFDPYEFIAVIIPGALPTFAMSLLVPEIATVLSSNGLELGEFGVFLIIAFVVGHVVQSLGNLIEAAEGRLGVGKRDLPFLKNPPVSADQWARFERCFSMMIGNENFSISRDSYSSVINQVYSRLHAEQRTQRIDAFNRTYGLCRGMVAGSIATVVLIILLGGAETHHYAAVVLLFLTIPLYIRMRRFSRLYLSEVVNQCLALDGQKTNK
ncbi:MAG: hypothetical protein LAT81_12645 [Oceanicaulis sp.]|nr:hypothetical protein [Oceanicaulis sp.]